MLASVYITRRNSLAPKISPIIRISLHAHYDEETNTGGIRLWKFRDPNVSNGSNLTEEERKAFRIKQKNAPIALIRSQISWRNVFIDSAVIPVMEGREGASDIIPIIFSAGANFSSTTFSAGADFLESTFSAGANFSSTTFSAGADFLESTFSAEANFRKPPDASFIDQVVRHMAELGRVNHAVNLS